MPKMLCGRHARRAGILLASGLACAVVPAVANASAVNLGTASPFVVLAFSTATNTGASVLNGDLGVAPGTSLVGFSSPAVVNGATHDDDAVAGQALLAVGSAYGVAAGQPVSPGNDLTGQDLGGLTLQAGAYRFSSSAQMTGQLTLDAAGDPNAQFVFEIGSTLTTASASSVRLINGASPCNIYWQVGSSATLGTTTALMGNVLAHDSISLDDSATVQGRLLALGGAVTLIHNTIDGSMCGTSTTPPPGSTPPGTTPTATGSTPTTTGSTPPMNGSTLPNAGPGGAQQPTAGQSTLSNAKGSAILRRTKPPTTLMQCTFGYTATVRGRELKRVVFSIDGKRLASRSGSPFSVHVPAAIAGSGRLTARVTFKDATRAKTLSLRYRACAAGVVQPLPGPSAFTG